MSDTAIRTQLRNAELPDLVALLREQDDVKYDVVASSDRIGYTGGKLVVKGGAVEFTDEGVTEVDAILNPTTVFDSGVSERLGIPINYLRKMRDTGKADLLDHNVNAWLEHDPSRKFLIRGFLGSGNSTGVARAFLSDRYHAYDHLDLLLAVLEGAKGAGVQLDVISADLSERKMRVRVGCPEIAALAPILLDGYNNPFADATPERAAMLEAHGWLKPEDRPVVHAGFVFENSETGNGMWAIKPELIVKACTNGLTIKADKFGKVHIGGKLDEGVITWSDATRLKNIELVKSQAADAVAQFVSAEFIAEKIAEIEAKAGLKVTSPTETLEKLGKQFTFSKTEQDLILADFITGGQLTTGGVLNAVTSVAQRIVDPDRAAEIQNVSMDVFEAAVVLAR